MGDTQEGKATQPRGPRVLLARARAYLTAPPVPGHPMRRMGWGLMALLALCVSVFALVTVYAVGRSDSTIDGVSGAFMEQMSAQIRLNFASEVRLYRSELESVSLTTHSRELRATDDLRGIFAAQAAARGFAYAATISADGTQDVLLGEELALDDYPTFRDATLSGQDLVTSGTTADGQTMLLLAEPVERPMAGGGNSVLVAVGVPISETVDALSLDVSATQVYTHIVRADGTFVLNSGSIGADQPSYLQLLRDNEGRYGVRYDITADELAEVMAGRQSAFYVANVSGSRYASFMAPLDGTDWFIVSVLPYSVLHDPIDSLVWSLVGASFVGCLLLLAALFVVFVSYLRLLRAQVAELDRARAAADDASRAKSEFLSNMSHDIRTPMNAIVGMTQIARERTSDPAAVSDCLDKIAASSAHLLGLINDVLDMSRIESGRLDLTPEPCQIEEVVRAAADIARPQAEARGQRFVVEVGKLAAPAVMVDRTRLSQVLLNLLTNAVKFTPPGGSVWLRLEQESGEKNPAADGSAGTPAPSRVRTHLWVRDTGIGMSEEFQRKIFDSFEREDTARVRKTEGTGLGMAIVKRIVDGMGGSVDVASKKGEGSCFHVTLDLERCADADGSEAEVAPEDLAGLHVLLAEDNDINWEVASELLGACGLELDWAENGRECVDRFAASEVGHYDVVLMDVRMPEMNGYEAARAIRALGRPDAPAVPIIAMTADAFAKDRAMAREAGMNAHVAKPIDLREALRVIGRCVAARRAGEKSAAAGGAGASAGAGAPGDADGPEVLLAPGTGERA